MTKPLVRYAPSPTGYQHVGNIRAALVNWLFARKHGGQFLLRFDDTDAERTEQKYIEAITEDLHWVGLGWDGDPISQAARKELYASAITKLKDSGRIYACYETPLELDIQRKQLAARGLPPIYNRAGLELSDTKRAEYEAEGRKPHWRFLLEEGNVEWNDLVRGEVKLAPRHMSDPVLIRENGVPFYTMASVVDDGEMGITHVIRGEDHVSNTAVQLQLFAALGLSAPQFAHLALLKTKEGELSKRVGGDGTIRGLREEGILPGAITSLLARLGTSQPVEPYHDLAPLVESFSFDIFGRAPANFDVQELLSINEKLIHTLPFDAVKNRFPQLEETFWNTIRHNLTSLDDAKQWWSLINEDVVNVLSSDEREFVSTSAEHLPAEPWDESTYKQWVDAVKTASGRKGKELFMPLRKALTGMEHGPELQQLLLLLGREKTLKRLNG